MGLKKIHYLIVLSTAVLFYSCSKEVKQEAAKPLYELQKNSNAPKFDGDNAYTQVETQVKFGPRNPGSKGHQAACGTSEFYIRWL
jgi:hypothetical protein